jgi:hypothetical protein
MKTVGGLRKLRHRRTALHLYLTPRQFGFMHEVLKSGFGTSLGKVKNLGGVSGHSGSAYQGFCVKRELPRATRVSFARVRFSLDYNQSRPAKSEKCRLIEM